MILLILKVRSSSTFKQKASMYIAPYLREYSILLMWHVITVPLRVQYSIFIVSRNTTALCIISSIVIAYINIEWVVICRRREWHIVTITINHRPSYLNTVSRCTIAYRVIFRILESCKFASKIH